MQKLCRSLVALLVLTSASFAQAQVVTYTFSGSADGNVGGNAFTAQTYTFSVTALAATVQNGAPPYSNVLTGGTITVSGTACAAGCSITNPGNYLVFNTAGVSSLVHGLSLVGELDVPGETLIEGCWAATCGGKKVNDNLVKAIAPTASGEQGAEAPYVAFATSGGVVQIIGLDGPITYSVALA